MQTEQLRLTAAVEAGLQTVETAVRIAELQAGSRQTSAEELRPALERCRPGLATSIEVVDARANLSQTERNETSAISEFRIAFAALESLIGVPLGDWAADPPAAPSAVPSCRDRPGRRRAPGEAAIRRATGARFPTHAFLTGRVPPENDQDG